MEAASRRFFDKSERDLTMAEAAVLAGLSGLAIAWLALRQIGGQTGDVLGGAEQVAETAILVLLAARLEQP